MKCPFLFEGDVWWYIFAEWHFGPVICTAVVLSTGGAGCGRDRDAGFDDIVVDDCGVGGGLVVSRSLTRWAPTWGRCLAKWLGFGGVWNLFWCPFALFSLSPFGFLLRLCHEMNAWTPCFAVSSNELKEWPLCLLAFLSICDISDSIHASLGKSLLKWCSSVMTVSTFVSLCSSPR